MNDESKIEEAIKEQPKSKRLSSLIWIFVLWGCARAFSEFHPQGWEHLFFWKAPLVFGAFPATGFLLLSIVSRSTWLEGAFRLMALTSVLLSVTGLIAIVDATAEGVGKAQATLFFVQLLSIFAYKNVAKMGNAKVKND